MKIFRNRIQQTTPNRNLSQPTEKRNKLCLRALCESESGWHEVGSPIEYESLSSIPDIHYAYLIRIMSLIKHSSLDLNILSNSEKLETLIKYIEENLSQSSDEISAQSSPYRNSSYTTTFNRQIKAADVSNFKESYHSIKNYVLNKLAAVANAQSQTQSQNQNQIEHFQLNRCSLPSGKIVWLCETHSQEKHVQILTSSENVSINQFQNDEFSSILLEELKKYK